MILRLCIIVFLFCFGYDLPGQIVFQESSQVHQLMQQFETLGKEEVYIEGWRIKLVSTTDRRKLESTRWLFERSFPEYVYSMSHENPYYSLKAGAFSDRFELEPALIRFKEHFPGALPFRDRIMKSELFE